MFQRMIFWLLAVSAALAPAQTVTITTAHFGGSTPATGTLYWQPVLADGTPTSYQLGGGGQVQNAPIAVTVARGVSSATLPDTSLTNPQNVCFKVTFEPSTGGPQTLGPGYSCVQPAANNSWCTNGVCNFDSYAPSIPALAQNDRAITSITGDATATGPGAAALTLATVNASWGSCGDGTHVCQITTDGKGRVVGQAQVAITAGSSPPLAGLVADYKADSLTLANGASVASWPDSSGNGNTATQTTGSAQPTIVTNAYGSHSAVQFNPDGQTEQNMVLPSSLALTGDRSVFFIMKPNVWPGATLIEFGTKSAPWLLNDNDSPLFAVGVPWHGLAAYISGATGWVGSGASAAMPKSLNLVGIASTSSAVTFYINDFSTTVSESYTEPSTVGGYLGGSDNVGPFGYDLSADVLEVLVYSHALSASEYQQIQQYAYTTYGIIHSGWQNQIVLYGNSITAGSLVANANSWANQVATTRPNGWIVRNESKPGEQTSQLISVVGTNLQPFATNTYGNDIAILQEVTNDLCLGGVSQTTAYNNLVTLAQDATSEGYTVLVMTVLPVEASTCTGDANFESDRLAINNEIRQNFVRSGYAAGVIDVASDPTMGNVANVTNTTYYAPGGEHPTEVGDAILASYVEKALFNLQGPPSDFWGTCTMASATTCTASIAVLPNFTPVCMATQQTPASPVAASCSVTGTGPYTVTVTAASSNSSTWGYHIRGNPN